MNECYVIYGQCGETDGTSSMGYDDIASVINKTELFVLGTSELGTKGENSAVFLVLKMQNGTGVYGNETIYGALKGVDTENHLAFFTLANGVEVQIDADNRVTIL